MSDEKSDPRNKLLIGARYQSIPHEDGTIEFQFQMRMDTKPLGIVITEAETLTGQDAIDALQNLVQGAGATQARERNGMSKDEALQAGLDDVAAVNAAAGRDKGFEHIQ
jgi:hypothetical protein